MNTKGINLHSVLSVIFGYYRLFGLFPVIFGYSGYGYFGNATEPKLMHKYGSAHFDHSLYPRACAVARDHAASREAQRAFPSVGLTFT